MIKPGDQALSPDDVGKVVRGVVRGVISVPCVGNNAPELVFVDWMPELGEPGPVSWDESAQLPEYQWHRPIVSTPPL